MPRRKLSKREKRARKRRAKAAKALDRLDPVEHAERYLLAPRGICPTILQLSLHARFRARKGMEYRPELESALAEKRETKRDLRELSAERDLQHAEERQLLRWIPQPVPRDASDWQVKRSVLAGTGFVCYLENLGESPETGGVEKGRWYIAKEVWDGTYSKSGDRFGVKSERQWSGPYISESTAKKALLRHALAGHNLESGDNQNVKDYRRLVRMDAHRATPARCERDRNPRRKPTVRHLAHLVSKKKKRRALNAQNAETAIAFAKLRKNTQTAI